MQIVLYFTIHRRRRLIERKTTEGADTYLNRNYIYKYAT